MATEEISQRYAQLTVASRYSGFSIDCIRKWIKTGKLQGFRPCGRLLVDLQELDSLIRGTSIKTAESEVG